MPVRAGVLVLVLLPLCLAVGCGRGSGSADGVFLPVRSDTEWHLVSEGALAYVYVEKALYERRDLPHFYVRIRVEPKGDHVVHLDLASERAGFRPNQWGIHPEPRRGSINERRVHQVAGFLEGEPLARARADFERGEWIAVGGADGPAAVDTFRPFNASSPAEVRSREGSYFILSLDGNARVSDGRRFENVAIVGDDYSRFDLVLPRPVVWKRLPDGSDLLRPRPVPQR